MNQPWNIQLLAELRLQHQERTVTRFRTQKTGALLAYLAYHSQHAHAREVLIELFWPDTPPESGRHNLSHALSSLRAILEPPGVPAGTVIVADRFTVALNPEACTADVARFDAALRRAAQNRTQPQYAALLDEALAHYTGPLLPGYYEDWIAPAQERLRQRFQEALRERAQLHHSAGRLPDAIELAQRALETDPELDDVAEMLERLRQQAQQPPPAVPARPAPEAPALPTGTVTVLMTDIEGSTALFEAHADPYRSALADHHRLLRRTVPQHGGHELKEVGDAFVVLFASVADALSGALAYRRALAEHPWPEEIDPLKVRMALHTGDVEREGGEYRGLLLHRASRMLAAAHGGQLICSEPTARLLARDLAPGVRLRDLGLWRLRDLPEPERLFQASEGDDTPFPALRATPAHSAHLPLQFTRFFGREQEIARIGELLDGETRLLTLTGPGGTGKTRLAVESVGRWAERFEGSVWFVPLADLSEAQFVPQAILQALGVALTGSASPWEQAQAALSRQETLLILDNFEQLVEEGAESVQSLLERVPGLRCVATSRRLLGLPGEVEFAVSPLPTPGADAPLEGLSLYDSVALFVDRAQSARADFRITAQNAAALAELCDRLEGIPLAIELAAARALVLSPSQMLSQLGNRFEFLVSRRRGVSERQRTLRAAIDWSYRLLDPALRRFFCALSVFRGGWTLEAAEAVCGEALALDLLAQLREASLVSAREESGGVRFRMLETLREFGWEQLEEAERRELEERLDDFLLQLSEAAEPHLEGPEPLIWLDVLEAEHDNIRASLAQAVESVGEKRELGLRLAAMVTPFWNVRGHYDEGRAWFSQLLGGTKGDPAVRAKALGAACRLASVQEDTARQALAEEAMAIHRELGNQGGIARSMSAMAGIAHDRGDLEVARRGFEETLTFCRELGDRRGIAIALGNLGRVNWSLGDFAAARTLYEESLSSLRDLSAQGMLALYLAYMGQLAESQEDYETTRKCFQESMGIARVLGRRSTVERCLRGYAGMANRNGELRRAVRLWAAAERQREELGTPLALSERSDYEQRVAEVRAAFGDDAAFDAAWAEGRAMTLEQAVDLALGNSAAEA